MESFFTGLFVLQINDWRLLVFNREKRHSNRQQTENGQRENYNESLP